jgi:hypothetical protein
MRLCIVVVGALVGCSSIEGEWSGECALSQGSQHFVYEVTSIEIELGSGDKLEGSGEVLDPNNTLGRGDIDGTQDGDEVDFLVRFTSGLEGELNFLGTVDGSKMEGDCRMSSQYGRFELSRDQ